ncbi:MAG: OsmC family protein [Hyphomicrobiaceae bacterium]|nr:MAG: OsmC family protein [Hyphomicrobiaceae bacterium]
MIVARSLPQRFSTLFGDGAHEGLADAIKADGGAEAGFKPHVLLEAALATCITITIRMYAERKGMSLPGLETRVKLDQSRADAPVLRYDVDLGEARITEEQRARLLRVAEACPIHKILKQPLMIERSELVV